MKSTFLKRGLAGLLFVVFACSGTAQTVSEKKAGSASNPDRPDAGNLRAFIELARSDLKTQKALIVAENLPMTEGEAAEFWPLHRDYEADLSKVNDQKIAFLVRYNNEFATMTEKEAEGLAKASFDLESKRTDLKRKYFNKFKKVMPATKAARFFQIENQINLALDLRVAASLPLIK